MQQDELKRYINGLIARNELWRFYKSKEWIKLKSYVLKVNHYECAECKKKGIITRYDVDRYGNKHRLSTVHHIVFVKDNPALALTLENLEPVCKACHNRLHPEKFPTQNEKKVEGFQNVERW